jgi:hypothetical protein
MTSPPVRDTTLAQAPTVATTATAPTAARWARSRAPPTRTTIARSPAPATRPTTPVCATVSTCRWPAPPLPRRLRNARPSPTRRLLRSTSTSSSGAPLVSSKAMLIHHRSHPHHIYTFTPPPHIHVHTPTTYTRSHPHHIYTFTPHIHTFTPPPHIHVHTHHLTHVHTTHSP